MAYIAISIKNLAGELTPLTIKCDRHHVRWLRHWVAQAITPKETAQPFSNSYRSVSNEKNVALIRRDGDDWKRLSNHDTIQEGDEVGYFIRGHSKIELFRCCNPTDDGRLIATNVWTCWYPPTDERVQSFQFEYCSATFRNVAGSTISTDSKFATLEDLLVAMQDYLFTDNNLSDILHAWDIS